MANELTMSMALSFLKNGLQLNHTESTVSTVSGATGISNVQAVGTSNEQIVFGDTSPGYVYIENLDATNYVEIFGDSGNTQKISKLLAADWCILKLDGSTSIYGRANTASCNCLVIAVPL